MTATTLPGPILGPALLALVMTAGACREDLVSLVPPLPPPAAGDACTPNPPPRVGPLNYGEALQKSLYFFEAQQLGRLPAGHRVPWRADALWDDGRDVGQDLAGGWQDGATAVKVTATEAYATAMLSWAVLEWPDAFVRSCQLPHALAQIRWGAQALLRRFTGDLPGQYEIYAGVGDPAEESALWAAPEVRHMLGPRNAYRITTDVPGPDVAGHVAAALAAASLVFRREGEVALADRLLTKAERAFAFGDSHRGVPGDPDRDGRTVIDNRGVIGRAVPFRGGGADKLLWAAAWLHRATSARTEDAGTDRVADGPYLLRARALHGELTRDPEDALTHWRHQSVFQMNKGAAALLAIMTGGARPWVELIQNHLDWWTIGFNDSPKRTPDGLAWRQPGKAVPAAVTAAFLALVYGDAVTPAMCRSTRSTHPTHRDGACRDVYLAFARDSLDYVLGKNAAGRSYLSGYGENAVSRVRHAAAMGGWAGRRHFSDPALAAPRWRHTLFGALVGGPDDQGVWSEAAPGVQPPSPSHESTLEFVAPFVGAAARLFRERGGLPLAVFPPAEPRDDEYFVEVALGGAGDEVTAILNNRSAWPPTVKTRLSFRYFVRLEPGVSQEAVKVETIHSECGPDAVAPRLQRRREDLHHVEVDCTGTALFPGGATADDVRHWQKRVSFRLVHGDGPWDPANDPSAQGLTIGGPSTKAPGVVVYDEGRPLHGVEP